MNDFTLGFYQKLWKLDLPFTAFQKIKEKQNKIKKIKNSKVTDFVLI